MRRTRAAVGWSCSGRYPSVLYTGLMVTWGGIMSRWVEAFSDQGLAVCLIVGEGRLSRSDANWERLEGII